MAATAVEHEAAAGYLLADQLPIRRRVDGPFVPQPAELDALCSQVDQLSETLAAARVTELHAGPRSPPRRSFAGRDRSAACGRATTHDAAVRGVIGQRPVAGARFVPDGDVTGGPPPSNLHFRVVELAVENAKSSPAVGVVEPGDLHRVERRQPHGRPTGFGVQAHQRLFDRWMLGDQPSHDIVAMVPAHRVQQRVVWDVHDAQRPAELCRSGSRRS
jgi:hypothetical protein